MKFTFVYLFACLCATVMANGKRGAGERAYIYNIYMQEEIFNNPWTSGGIASGCVGTRTGLRGQENRCTLKEFCEYIWLRTKDGEIEPDPERTKWTPWTDVSADKAWNKDRIVSERIATIIHGVKEIQDGNVLYKKTREQFYTGWYDAAKVLPGFSTEPEEYYKLARELGDWEVSAHKEIEKELANPNSKLTDEQKQRFRNWNMESPRAAKLVVGLREAEINRVTLLELAKDIYFGHPVVPKQNTLYSEFNLVGKFDMPDREATIAKYASEMGGEAAAAARYDKAYNNLLEQDASKEHKKAVDSFRHSWNHMTVCRG